MSGCLSARSPMTAAGRSVWHGHLPEREIMPGMGPIGVRCPRMPDRAERMTCFLSDLAAVRALGTPRGKNELGGLMDGMRESAESWRELLPRLKRRGWSLHSSSRWLGFWPKTRHSKTKRRSEKSGWPRRGTMRSQHSTPSDIVRSKGCLSITIAPHCSPSTVWIPKPTVDHYVGCNITDRWAGRKPTNTVNVMPPKSW